MYNTLGSAGKYHTAGPPGFTGPSTPYGKKCFESPYVTVNASTGAASHHSQNIDCISTLSMRGPCYFDAECPNGGCVDGSCGMSEVKYPRIIRRLPDGAQDQKYLACREGAVLIENVDGTRGAYCPIPYENGTMPACQQTMQHVWQCDKYRAAGRDAEYDMCKKAEQCFVYNAEFPDGTVHPVSVRMTPFCMDAARASLEQSATRCVTCDYC